MLLDYILLKHHKQLMHLKNELNKLQKLNIFFLKKINLDLFLQSQTNWVTQAAACFISLQA